MRSCHPLSLTPLLALAACGQPDSGDGEPVAGAAHAVLFERTEANERDAAWSPDGQWILFGSTRAGNEDIWKKPVAGGDAVQLTTAESNELYAEWSPDGSRIAFTSNHGGRANVWTMSADGGEMTRVTTDADSVQGGTFGGSIIGWSPDGEWIAFASGRGAELGTDVYAIPAGGGTARPIASSAQTDFDPKWSPDGRWVAFGSSRAGNLDIWIAAADGSGSARQLTTNPADDRAPSWSPDGRWIAFQSVRSGQSHLWLVPAAGGTPVQLTDRTELDDFVVHWSPDGTRICFNSASVGGDLHVLGVDESEPRSLGVRARGNLGAFGRDGRQVAILSLGTAGQVDVTIATRDGGQARPVTRGGSAWMSGWSTLDWSPDGSQIVYNRGAGVTDLWAVAADGGEPWQVTLTPDSDLFPRFSPDGSRIAYTGRTESGWDLWVIPAEGGIAERVTSWPKIECCASWSPDGTRLAFSTLRDAGGHDTQDWHVWTIGVDGSDPVWIAKGDMPDWSPDGRQILFVRDHRTTDAHLATVPATGGEPSIVYRGLAPEWPRWSPDGSEILFGQSLLSSGDIYTADVSAFVR